MVAVELWISVANQALSLLPDNLNLSFWMCGGFCLDMQTSGEMARNSNHCCSTLQALGTPGATLISEYCNHVGTSSRASILVTSQLLVCCCDHAFRPRVYTRLVLVVSGSGSLVPLFSSFWHARSLKSTLDPKTKILNPKTPKSKS